MSGREEHASALWSQFADHIHQANCLLTAASEAGIKCEVEVLDISCAGYPDCRRINAQMFLCVGPVRAEEDPDDT